MTKEKFINVMFFLVILSELLFSHSNLARIILLVYFFSLLIISLKKNKLIISPFIFSYIALVFVSIIHYTFNLSINADYSNQMTLTLIINLGFIIASHQYYLINNNLKAAEKILYYAIIAAAIITFSVSFPDLINYGRLGITGNFYIIEINPNILGMALSFAYIIKINMSITQRKKPIGAIIILILTILTGSRKAIIMILIGSLLLGYYYIKKLKIKNILFSSAAIVIIFLMIFTNDFLYNVMGSRLENILLFMMGNNNVDSSLLSRFDYINLGIRLVKNNPFIGYGFDTFRTFPESYGTYSHNNYIELLVSGGYTVLFLYYIPILIIFFKTLIVLILRKKTSVTELNFMIIFILLLSVEYAAVTYFDRFFLLIIILGVIGSNFHKSIYIAKNNHHFVTN